jgi:hypothetical protein
MLDIQVGELPNELPWFLGWGNSQSRLSGTTPTIFCLERNSQYAFSSIIPRG